MTENKWDQALNFMKLIIMFTELAVLAQKAKQSPLFPEMILKTFALSKIVYTRKESEGFQPRLTEAASDVSYAPKKATKSSRRNIGRKPAKIRT